MDRDNPWPSVNRLAAPLVARLVADAESLGVTVERQDDGTTLVDGGIDCAGSLAAGLRVAEISMGGLGSVRLAPIGGLARWPWRVSVQAANPVLACLGSQYAGWSLSHGEGKKAYTALGSGPGRALAAKEPLFQELAYKDQADEASLVLEVDRRPPAALVRKIQRDCGVPPEGLTLILTPTTSLAGTLQVVARVLEVALHKVHELGFPLERIVDGLGSAPLPPPAPTFVEAMGRTNDAIIYGGTVQLLVSGPEDDARELAQQLPSGTSRDHGKPFAAIFQAFKGDFYAIDPLLFGPARVIVSALESGRSFQQGNLDEATIDRSFGAGAV